ncbi:hypothetical protein VMT65_22500 [Nocardia sp. CDC153]|uniref:hypothetical protein n=1 Tax=Nocardia sp. CDC153 TaxID=3112167 RepID=UPI002DB71688|nr:hypothetical protein [Nocardia sp. CDC153]MEC3955821.1 hypothetical protein [Nocardia sp. CDC153]
MTSAEFAAVATAVASDARTLLDRIAALRGEIDVLYQLAHGIAAVTGSANSTPPSEGTQGTLAAHVVVVPGPEASA